MVDTLARRGSGLEFAGPEPAVGISVCPAKMAVNRWVQRKYQQRWDTLRDYSHGKLLLRKIPLGRPGGTVLVLGREQLKTNHGTYYRTMWSESIP